MIYLTQLIYLQPGQETVFDAFEAVAIPLIAKYNGQLLLRLRPGPDAVLEHHGEVPYEVHFVQFNSEADFVNFSQDEERKRFLHLKGQSIRASLLVKGARV